MVEGRNFLVEAIKFDNGHFVSISEGAKKLGSMVVSLGTGPTPITTTVIPAKTESIFLKLTAEQISTTMRGIAIVSVFFQNELDTNSAKTLMREIVEIVKNA